MPEIMIGVWQLISFKLQPVDDPDAEPIMPHGPRREDHRGRGIMTADGYMGAFVSQEKGIIRLPNDDFRLNSDEDIAKVARAFSSYCGRLSLSDVKGLDGLVHTEVEMALNTAWIGGRQTRKFHMERENGHDYMTLQPLEPMVMQVSLMWLFAKIRLIRGALSDSVIGRQKVSRYVEMGEAGPSWIRGFGCLVEELSEMGQLHTRARWLVQYPPVVLDPSM